MDNNTDFTSDEFVISDDETDDEKYIIIKNYLSNLSAVYLISVVEMLVQMHKEENLNKLLRLKRQFAIHAATTHDFMRARHAYKQIIEHLELTDEPVVSVTPQLLDGIFNISKSSSSLNMRDINARRAVRTLLAL